MPVRMRPSSTKTRFAEPSAVASDRSIESLLHCAEVLAAQSDAKSIAQVLSELLHDCFFPASAGMLIGESQGLRVVGFASQDPGLRAPLAGEIEQEDRPLAQILRRACNSGDPELQQFEISPESAFQFGTACCLPFDGSHSRGVVALFLTPDQRLDESDCSFFSLLARSGILAFSNAELREAADSRLEVSERHRNRAETLVSYATDLGSAVELDDLVEKFTSRSMQMLEANAGFMALVRGARSQIVALKGIPSSQERQVASLVNRALETVINKPSIKTFAITGEQFDLQLAGELGWRQVMLVPLYGTGKQLLALLGLVECRRNSSSDIELIQAMAAHAAVALQNSQLFARITRSSREWAEMFDSISDLMLLHDEQQRVVRVNRSLSEKLDKQPSQVLGLLVRDLFAASSNLPACPFCLDLRGREFREEFREPKTGSIYLVSSSRVRGAVEDSQQVVHVLKDVTASRRAERLYRELFDNIQEGAYFSAPDGRLLEVNDALVRMLGYNSR